SFQLNMELFSFAHGLTMTSKPFARLFGGPPRTPEAPITQREMDLARSVQVVMEDILLRMARFVYAQTGQRNLCLAGGVALNCVANGRILREGPFDDIWIQPAAGDAGGALGAAYAAWHEYLDKPRVVYQSDAMGGSFLGPEFSDAEIEDVLRAHGVPYPGVRGLQVRRNGPPPGRRQGSRMVSGQDGVWATSARRTIHPRRSARA